VAARCGDELFDERVVRGVVDQDLAGGCFRSALDVKQAIASEDHRFGVVEPGLVLRIDNGLEGAGVAVEAEDLVAAAVIGEARADEQVVARSAEGDAGRIDQPVAAGEDIDEVALLAVVTKHGIAAAADVEVVVGTEGEALRFLEAATTGELALEGAGFAVVGQDAVRVAAADLQRNGAGGRRGPRGQDHGANGKGDQRCQSENQAGALCGGHLQVLRVWANRGPTTAGRHEMPMRGPMRRGPRARF
jgi:hypothetical protein